MKVIELARSFRQRNTGFGPHQRGVGMLEVLIAMLVVSIGALGFAGVQLRALSYSDEANYRSHATLIAQDAIERFNANPARFAFYTSPNSWPAEELISGAAPIDWKACINAECNAEQMSRWDVAQLNWMVANTLPSGRIQGRSCDFNGLDCVVISWDGYAPGDCLGSGGIATEIGSACLVMEVVR